MRELIRADEKRKAIEQLEVLLLEGIVGEGDDVELEDWAAMRKEAIALAAQNEASH